MHPLSPWAVAASAELANGTSVIFEHLANAFYFKVFAISDSIWIQAELPGAGRVAFRVAYSPASDLEITKTTSNQQQGIALHLRSAIGKQRVSITIDQTDEHPVLHYTSSLVPAKELMITSWPRDILFYGKKDSPEHTEGKIHTSQFGTRTGSLYLSQTRPKSATLFYLQNLTALSAYAEQTETTLGDSVGGAWPELGFSLPAAKKPLKAGKEVILADAFIAFSEEVPKKKPI